MMKLKEVFKSLRLVFIGLKFLPHYENPMLPNPVAYYLKLLFKFLDDGYADHIDSIIVIQFL